MKKVLLVSFPLLLAACGTLPNSGGEISGLAVVPSKALALSGTLQAERVRETESTLKHIWTITKAPVDDGQAATAVFTVTATRISISAIAIKSLTTTVKSGDLSVCNPGLSTVNLTASSATLTGLDSGGVAMPTTINLGNLFGAMPQSLAGGSCMSATFSVSSADPALTPDEQAMLNAAAQFSVALSVSTTTASTYQTPAVTPTQVNHNTPYVVGDATVTLSDPGFTAQSLSLPASIIGDTTVKLSKVYTCADRANLRLVAGTTNQYVVPNTATLSGPSTNLSASAQDTVTLNCDVPPDDGCTFTQGYYKSHAQYRSAADAQNAVLNKQYDPAAWKGARNWSGSESKLTVGGVAYTQAQLVGLYLTAPKGNQALSLFHQLVTAKLNTLKQPGAVASASVAQAILAADAFFAANPNWAQGQYSGTPSGWISTITNFNEGLDNGHC